MLKLIPIVLACALALCWVSVSRAAGADEPPVFDKRPYAEAKKAAEDGKKWFIAKATASWCGPCKRMDKTTWRDEKVVKWLGDHAIVVAVDVDEQKSIAKDLGIEVMPTMVAFKDGKEFDRVLGYKDAAELLVWLEGMAKGEKSIEAVKKRAGTRDAAGGKVDVRARMDLARTLQGSGKKDEAADEYVWLWKHMLEHDPAYYGVRLSFMVGDMQRLAEQSKGAREKFGALRDEAGKALEGEKIDTETLVDWVALNKVIGDEAATLGWYDKVKDQRRAAPLIKRVSRDLTQIFIEKERWADLGKMYADPVAEIESEHELMAMSSGRRQPKGMDEETRKQLEAIGARAFREKAGQVYAGLLAAGREKDAAAAAAKAKELDAKPAMTVELITWALNAGQARKVQLEWIDAGKGDSSLAELRSRVETELKDAGKK